MKLYTVLLINDFINTNMNFVRGGGSLLRGRPSPRVRLLSSGTYTPHPFDKPKVPLPRGLAAASVLIGGALGVTGSWVVYDQRTQHGMRKLEPWKWEDSLARAANRLASLGLRPDMPALSMEDLSGFGGDGGAGGNGSARIYIGVGGAVYDVSPSTSFEEGGPYSAWRGKDATVALATSSLDPETANSQAWGGLSTEELHAVVSWMDYFDQKYYRVARCAYFPAALLSDLPPPPAKHARKRS